MLLLGPHFFESDFASVGVMGTKICNHLQNLKSSSSVLESYEFLYQTFIKGDSCSLLLSDSVPEQQTANFLSQSSASASPNNNKVKV